MKKIIFWMAFLASAVVLASSCEEKTETTHWIQYEEGSTNYTVNLSLQLKVNSEVAFNVETMDNSFTGTEDDAIAWFNEKMDYLESDEFANASPQVPVLDGTTATFSLRSLDGNEEDGTTGRKVTTREVTFK